MRYFHQPKEYWLKHGTLQDWQDIYSRELRETPPVDVSAHTYLIWAKVIEPDDDEEGVDAAEDAGEPEVWDCPLPDVTE